MGVCQSGEDVAAWGDDEVDEQRRASHKRENKATGELEDFDPADGNHPDEDFFEFEEEGATLESKEFMAVKPWIGSVKEPDNHPEVDKSQPDETYTLEHAYGYRCQDSRQNVFYNGAGNVVYMTACLGVILDKESNVQTFFGGGEVDNSSKQVSSTANSHNNDIMSLKVNTSGGRNIACTGQVGKNAPAFTWDTTTGEKIGRIALAKNERGVAAIAISPDGSHVITADNHNDHHVTIWNMASKKQVMRDKGGPDPIFDVAFTKQDGKIAGWSGGQKHIAYWDVEKGKKKKGIFGNNPRTSFCAMDADDTGRCFAGAANSLIYVWQGNTCKQTLGFHEKGFIGAIVYTDGMLYSGGKDGRVNIIDGGSLECVKAITFGTLPRAIDVHDGKLIVGLRTGSIIECDLESESMTPLMESHNDGEVWGLAMDDSHVYTSGDDNQVKKWDPSSRTCVQTGIVTEAERKAKRNRASTLGSKPDSQSSRALAINTANGDLAICANDGHVYIKNTEDMETVKKELEDSQEWIEVAEYSPDGSLLAVGSHDTNIYIYDVNDDYSLKGTATKHNASLTCIDWSMDSTVIRSVCNAYELLFFDAEGNQDPAGPSNTTGTDWASQHCKFGWLVDGIFPKGTDGTHINGVDMNENQTLICAGDDYGLVQLFRNPCRKGSMPRSYRAHSEHVVRTKFGRGSLANYIFSVGGYDQTMLQWKLNE